MFYVPIEMTKEYVRENEVYAAKDGEIIRITPDMIKKVIFWIILNLVFCEIDWKKIYMNLKEKYERKIERGKAYNKN